MVPTQGQLIALVHALLDNAAGLAGDARLLHENQRYARGYALAALAGEEVGKIELCLDRLFGNATLTDRQFRRSWHSHAEKLQGLFAYHVAFVDEAGPVDPTRLRQRPHAVGGRKMDAIYVDFREGLIHTPAEITDKEALDLLVGVEVAIAQLTAVLSPLTAELVDLLELAGATVLAPLGQFMDSLGPDVAVSTLRDLVTRIQQVTAKEWASAIETDSVSDLLGLDQSR